MGYPPPTWPPPPPWPPPSWPTPPAPKPPVNGADVLVSVLLLIVTLLVAGAGAMMGVFSLAFLDHCPPATCSVEGAVTTALGTVAIATLIVLTGLILTIVRLSTRRPAWPWALGTLGLCVATFFLGAVGYTLAVG